MGCPQCPWGPRPAEFGPGARVQRKGGAGLRPVDANVRAGSPAAEHSALKDSVELVCRK